MTANLRSDSVMQELKQRITFTLFALIICRICAFIPMPFVNPDKLVKFAHLINSGLGGMLDIFSGGSIKRMSVLALGIMPYITASIIMQLITSSTPSLKKLKQEGDVGQRKISSYTKLLAIVISSFQGFAITSGLAKLEVLYNNSLAVQVLCSLMFTCGTMFLLWLGDRITEKGLGNGGSLIIFIGIVAEAPKSLVSVFSLTKSGAMSVVSLLALLLIFFATIMLVVFMERAIRVIPIQYPQQGHQFLQMGRQDHRSNYLPFKINTAGVVPPIFASALLLLPTTVVSFASQEGGGFAAWVAQNLGHGKPLFALTYSALIIFFTFFYNNVVFDTKDTADNLKKSNAFIAGIRPGENTASYLREILNKLSLIGAIYLVVVCIVPELLAPVYGYSFLLGGTGILIAINVITDTLTQAKSYIISSKYNKNLKRYNLGRG